MTAQAQTPPPRSKTVERFGSLLEATFDDGQLQTRVHRVASGVDVAQDGKMLALVWGHPRFLSGNAEAPKAFSLLEAYRRTGQFVAGQLREGFALFLWDGERQRLILATDRLARQKLYLSMSQTGSNGTSWRLTVSDKPSTLARALKSGWSEKALRLFMQVGRIPAPLTAWEGIEVLEAGTCRLYEDGKWQTSSFWQPRFAYLDDGDATPHAEEFEANLRQLIKQWKKDEAVFWLDGSLSSQLALQWMHEAGWRKPATFGFSHDASIRNKAERQCVDYYFCNHNAVPLNASALLMQLDHLAHAFEQPVADPNAIQALVAQGMADFSGRPLASTFALQYLLADDPVTRHALEAEHGLRNIKNWIRRRDDKEALVTRARHCLSGLHADAARDPENYAWLLNKASKLVGRPRTKSPVNQASYLSWHWQLADAVLMSPRVAQHLCDTADSTGWGPLSDQWLDWAVELPPQLKWRSGQGQWLIQSMFGEHLPMRPKRWPAMTWPDLALPQAGKKRPGWMERLDSLRDLGLLNDASWLQGKVPHKTTPGQREWLWRALFLSTWMSQYHAGG